MTKETIDLYSHNRTTFGGIVQFEDFLVKSHPKYNLNGSPIALRIISDWRFDEQCRKNIEARELHKNG